MADYHYVEIISSLTWFAIWLAMSDTGPKNQSILITGGAGFIGSHLAESLAEDNEVTVVDNLSNGTRSNIPSNADFIEADIGDRPTMAELFANTELVFHQAAQVSVDQSVEEPVSSHESNVDATLHLLELAREYDVRIVLASSCAIYGHPETVPISETANLQPTSPYGLEKLSIDHYARLYHKLYGVETVALRYFNVYGPRQTAGDYSGVINIFLEQASKGDPITINGDGTQTRDFVHVADIVRANLLASTTDWVGEAFNIGTGNSISIRNLAEQVRDVVGADVEIVHTDPRPGDIEHSRANTTKAERKLGFSSDVELKDGLETLI